MRLFQSLFANFRRVNPRISYVDRSFDHGIKQIERRTKYVANPLPFQDDPLKRRNRRYEERDQSDTQDEEKHEKPERTLLPIPYDVTPENRFELINRIMCPLHIVTYENQLKMKYTAMKNLLSDFGRRVKASGRTSVVVDSQMLPCSVEFTKRSPKIVEYRNKDEFSIWPGIDDNRKTVGFFIGEPSHHSNVVCVEPDHLIISKQSHRKIASLFQNYLRHVTPLDVCTHFSEGGNWRRFVVRSNEQGEHMIVGMMHPQDLTPDQLEEEKCRMKQYFQSLAQEFNIKSAYFNSMRTCRSVDGETNFHHLFGDEVLFESLLEKQFSISPDSFFQINTLAAEVLYTTVMDELAVSKNVTVIDLCSGTGTMAVLLAPHVRRVIGIEMNSQAVADANRNTALNGIKNVTFIQGAAEDIMPKLKDQFFGQKVVMIANPGRAGLRSSVISAIREMDFVEKLVYISCKPAGDALKNFFHLCTSPSYNNPGSPLLPVNAVPVDMFPQTDHVELVVTFERFH